MSTELPEIRAARKNDHVELASSQRTHLSTHRDFDDVQFLHHALAGISTDRVDLSVRVADWRWSAPFYINGMTGGTVFTGELNRELAIAARETGISMACGSMSIAVDAPDDPAVQQSFRVIRDENPHGFVMANLGIGRPPDDAVRAVELLQADALQVHLNAVQETAMPEGNREFSDWERSLAGLIDASPVPVVVKEVGFGLSRRTLERVSELGAVVADVSGRGGTDFLRIENARRDAGEGDYSMLSGFGQSAMECLLDAPPNGPELLASGGVRHAYDVVKCLAVGARAVGVAGTFLETVRTGGAEALIPLILRWKQQITAIFALLGATDSEALRSTDLLVRGRLLEYCELRGIDASSYARRSSSKSLATNANVASPNRSSEQ